MSKALIDQHLYATMQALSIFQNDRPNHKHIAISLVALTAALAVYMVAKMPAEDGRSYLGELLGNSSTEEDDIEEKNTNPAPTPKAVTPKPITPTSEITSFGVKLVVQRFDSATLACQPPPSSPEMDATNFDVSTPGLLVYISFTKKTAPNTKDPLQQATKALLGLPLLTTTAWEGREGNQPISVNKLTAQGSNKDTKAAAGSRWFSRAPAPAPSPTTANISIVVVPQANLVNSVKTSTSLQYHSQVKKDTSNKLYSDFLVALKEKTSELNCKNSGLGESWHEVTPEDDESCISLVSVISGTFGSRQEVEFKAKVGPFCHVFEF